MDRTSRPSWRETDQAVNLMDARTIRSAIGFFERLLHGCGQPNIAVRLWDGSLWKLRSDEPPVATLVLKHEHALGRMLRLPAQLSVGEAYIYDDIDITGSIDALLPVADHFIARRWTAMDWLRWAAATWTQRHVTRLPEESRTLSLHGRPHEKIRDKEAMRFHYDLPADFYRLWLDDSMSYSCAYFRHVDDGLDEAQTQKMAYLCKKLRLKPGDRVLDVGCGWGSFALYAAKMHGAIVHGITLSRRQAEFANERVAAAGLSRCCRIEVRDFRDVHGESLYDKIVSLGMVEHIGTAQLASYFDRARRLLTPSGTFLNQGIGTRDGSAKLGAFVDRYVFPDAEVLPIEDIVRAAGRCGFEIRDVESLREHSALTLEAWRARLEHHYEEAVQMVGEITYRVWRIYMAMAAYLFRQGRLSLYQTLCVKAINGEVDVPLTREDWYVSPLGTIRDKVAA